MLASITLFKPGDVFMLVLLDIPVLAERGLSVLDEDEEVAAPVVLLLLLLLLLVILCNLLPAAVTVCDLLTPAVPLPPLLELENDDGG